MFLLNFWLAMILTWQFLGPMSLINQLSAFSEYKALYKSSPLSRGLAN